MDPREVDAAVLLIDKLPEVLTLVEQDVLPLMRRLDTVGPELHAMLGLVEDLHNMVAGLRGMKLMRRCGENEPEDRGGTGSTTVPSPPRHRRSLDA